MTKQPYPLALSPQEFSPLSSDKGDLRCCICERHRLRRVITLHRRVIRFGLVQRERKVCGDCIRKAVETACEIAREHRW